MIINESKLRRIIRSVILENSHISSHIKSMLKHKPDFRDQYGFMNKAATIDIQRFRRELSDMLQKSGDEETAKKVMDLSYLTPSLRDKVKDEIGGGRDQIECIIFGREHVGSLKGTDEHIEKAIEICIELYQDTLSGGSMVKEMFDDTNSDGDVDNKPKYKKRQNIMRP